MYTFDSLAWMKVYIYISILYPIKSYFLYRDGKTLQACSTYVAGAMDTQKVHMSTFSVCARLEIDMRIASFDQTSRD